MITSIQRRLRLVDHAIQHTYDAAVDECAELYIDRPTTPYLEALASLLEHRQELLKAQAELQYGEEVKTITDLSDRALRVAEWLAEH